MVCPADQLPEAWVEQIATKSRQPHVMEFEGHEDVGSEEHPGRFMNVDAYRTWASNKQRMLYTMVNEAVNPDGGDIPDIGAVVWFGERANEHAPGREVTMGIRIYGEQDGHDYQQYRGRGLGSALINGTHQDASRFFPNQGLWLDLVEGNEPAHALYQNTGYVDLVTVPDLETPGQNRIVMANDTVFKQAA